MRCNVGNFKAKNTFGLLFIITVIIFVINILQSSDLTIFESSKVIKNENKTCVFCEKSIAIIGLVHNSESTIHHLLHQLQILSCPFKHVVYIFYESNSDDNTSMILQNWQQNELSSCYPSNNAPKITKIILDLLPSDITQQNTNLDRTERYAKYRNYLLRELKRYSLSISYSLDYVLMIDMDIISFLPMVTLAQMDYLLNTLEYSVMCNHGIFGDKGWYYDVFATIFIDGNWTRFDYFQWPEQRTKLDEIINADNFTEVMSCFNGIAIYKYQAIEHSDCRYIESEKELSMRYPLFIDKYLIKFKKIKENDRAMICEHIPFHHCLRESGHKIVLSRDALVFYNIESLNYTFSKSQ